jgi:tetratricopeptide (TPR) repeat protein
VRQHVGYAVVWLQEPSGLVRASIPCGASCPFVQLMLVVVVVLVVGMMMVGMGMALDGDTELQAGRYEQAVKAYSTIIEQQPLVHINYYKRSLAYLFNNKHTLALHDAHKVIELEPEFNKGYVHRGKILLRMGMCDQARVDFQRVGQEARELLQEAEKCVMLFPRVEAIYKARDWEGLVQPIQELVEICPNHKEIIEMEMEAFAEMKDYERLIASSGKLLIFDKNNMLAYLNRGKAYYLTGNDDMALK